MADALPAGALSEIESSCTTWLRIHGLNHRREVETLPLSLREEFRRLITKTEERWLDAGHGSCVLRESECRQWVAEAVAAFDGTRYALDSFAVMPNHVHALLQPTGEWEITKIVASWKKYSALRINRLLGREGSFWQRESFDHIVRDRDQLERLKRYIEENPRKARLREGEYHLARGTGIV